MEHLAAITPEESAMWVLSPLPVLTSSLALVMFCNTIGGFRDTVLDSSGIQNR